MKRSKHSEGNKTFCMAQWVHTYLSPQLERRLCCASLEKSTNFQQYIDSSGPTKKKIEFTTLEEHWNSDYMKGIRRDLSEKDLYSLGHIVDKANKTLQRPISDKNLKIFLRNAHQIKEANSVFAIPGITNLSA